MTYKSFATLATVLAVVALVGSPTAKADAASKQSTAPPAQAAKARDAAAPVLYAQAGSFGQQSGTRLDTLPVETQAPLAKVSDSRVRDTPLDLWSLVVAGMAVMGSLAFRRSPNK